MGSLVLLSKFWLSYFVLVIICLMQSLSHMLGMKSCSLTFLLESESGCYMQ